MAEKIWGIVAAAGIGQRMRSPRPKQYLPLLQRRVLDHALLAVCENAAVDGVAAGIRAGDPWWRAQPFVHHKLLAASRGGETRARTVLNAVEWLLKQVAADEDWAVIHDAARPCLRRDDLKCLIAAARQHGGGAVLALKLADALKQVDADGVITQTLGQPSGGAAYWRAQTPQMFRCGQLKTALRQALRHGVAPADESAAMEMIGVRPVVVPGHPSNLKITVPADLEWAARCMGARIDCAWTQQHNPGG